MQTMMNMIRRLVLPAMCLALCLSPLAIAGGSALAGAFAQQSGDRVHLHDGRVIEGAITREAGGYVWITAIVDGIEQRLVLRPADIKSIERGVGEPARPATRDTPRDTRDRPASDAQTRRLTGEATKRAAVISFGEGGDKDMVGIFATADSFRRAIPLLEEDGIDVLVIEFNSGGGALLEIEKISELIQYELKPKFEVKAWIRYCISAAAMSAHTIEEIYFMPQGSYGACTGWYGPLIAMEGRGLEEVLYMMERVSARGGHHPAIMRSMQINEPLSATINPTTGAVEWSQSEQGEHLVNPGTEILTLTSDVAERFGFSKGTAANLDELTEAMGYSELEWVGETVPGIPYPVSRAEKMLREFRARTLNDQQRFQEWVVGYQQALGIAQQMPLADRGPFVNRARTFLQRIAGMVRNNPNLAIFQLNMPDPSMFDEWYREQDEMLRRLMNPERRP